MQPRGVLLEPPQRLDDLGHARLVVGAEQRGAVGGDDRHPEARGQRRLVGGPDYDRRVAGQHDVAAVVARGAPAA